MSSEHEGRDRETGRVEAAVDRIVEGIAVVLVDDDELRLPVTALPADAHEGSIVTLLLDPSGDVVDVDLTDAAVEANRRREMEERLERLRQERSGGRFGADEDG